MEVVDHDQVTCTTSQDGIAVVTLNRPHALNALTLPLLHQLRATMTSLHHNNQVRVVVLKGAGKGFCSGADLKVQRAAPTPTTTAATTISSNSSSTDTTATATESGPAPHYDIQAGYATYDRVVQDFAGAILSIVNCSKLVIAAIHGPAAGAGASIALACDFRVMEEKSYLLQAFINIALVPDAGGSYFLTRQLGFTKALELCTSGKAIYAPTCLELGLANKMTATGQAEAEALAWARELAAKPMFALGLTKNVLQFSLNHTLGETIEYEARLQQLCIPSTDAQEGREAFVQKRKAKFGGQPPLVPRGLIQAARL
eukprot:TRINITY_DN5810_c0_g1_i2.p1 TRINITY_DN5810_c0_g1~~TRINITY_DN5810_c0_g1_i2.p1  ORF type:complete len:315 (+),score=43.17 TRINITY_DN5810_c0_g1_i2:20-964(+)